MFGLITSRALLSWQSWATVTPSICLPAQFSYFILRSTQTAFSLRFTASLSQCKWVSTWRVLRILSYFAHRVDLQFASFATETPFRRRPARSSAISSRHGHTDGRCTLHAIHGIMPPRVGLLARSSDIPMPLSPLGRRTIACSGARAARSFRLPLTPSRAPADA